MNGRQLYINFVDFENAFDSVHTIQLMDDDESVWIPTEDHQHS